MAVQIGGTSVIDDNRNVYGIDITADTACIIPAGNTLSRTSDPQIASIRINTQTSYPEYWNGSEWIEIVPAGDAVLSNNGRGVFAGGTPNSNSIQYITIQTTGNTTDFGDLNENKLYLGACASSTRGLFAGGQNPGNSNVIDYITIDTTGNATDFGDLTQSRHGLAGCNSPTRGVFGGGRTPGNTNRMDYVTIASTGNASTFGSLIESRGYNSGCSNQTRGIFAGGWYNSPGNSVRNTIDYITIASTGNGTDFGDLTVSRAGLAACSNTTRGFFGGGTSHPGLDLGSGRNEIDVINFGSIGASTDFGNLTQSRTYLGSCSAPGRGVFAGGRTTSPGRPAVNTIDYVSLAATGNASDFGDLASSTYSLAGLSDSNGGV
jgi:hypothetical protein